MEIHSVRAQKIGVLQILNLWHEMLLSLQAISSDGGGRSMRSRFIIMILLISNALIIASYAQPASGYQNVGGDFGKTWLNNLNASNPKPVENNSGSLWSWGSAPKGSLIFNGQLEPDPYYIWRSLNYSSGWMGEAYVDPKTGYPVYAYVDPYYGMMRHFYVDPTTKKAVYTDNLPTGNPDSDSFSPFGTSDFSMPASSYYTWVGSAPDSPYSGTPNYYDNLGAV
jgi:hypothetical protein